MNHFRLYFLDSSGRIYRARDLEALDDQEAFQRAERLALGRDWELWCGATVIAKSIFPRGECINPN